MALGKGSKRTWEPKPSVKAAIACCIALQFIRLSGIVYSAYYSYNKLLTKMEGVQFFDEVLEEKESNSLMEGVPSFEAGLEDKENNNSMEGVQLQGDEEYGEICSNRIDDEWRLQVIGMMVPILEIITAAGLIYCLMGPMSHGIKLLRWVRWLTKMRITWMRMLWVLTALVFVVLNIKYRHERCLITGKESYDDSYIEITQMWCLVGEFAFLGWLECTIKVYTVERLEERVDEAKTKMTGRWGEASVAAFLATSAVFALRNFSMSLYFGLLSVFVTNNEQEEVQDSESSQYVQSLTGLYNVIVVLQIYLAVMRGKYFNFYIRICFGYFLAEEEEFKFQTNDEKERKRDRKKKEMVEMALMEKPDDNGKVV